MESLGSLYSKLEIEDINEKGFCEKDVNEKVKSIIKLFEILSLLSFVRHGGKMRKENTIGEFGKVDILSDGHSNNCHFRI